MKKSHSNAPSLFLVVGWMFCVATATLGQEFPSQRGEELATRIEIQDQRATSLRLEVFDGNGSVIYDSGVLPGRTLEFPATEIFSAVEPTDTFVMEVRAWSSEGDLLVSQVTKTSNLGEISTINFEVIPTATLLASDAITLAGNVDVFGDLDVASTIRAGGLQNSVGGAFFGSCSAGSSIRSISSTGSVTCENDDTGSGGDNLGNHSATANLQMGGHTIQFSNGIGIHGAGGANFKTGPLGETFQFQAGGGTADIARFKDLGGNLKLAVLANGGLDFHGGQKVCSAFDASGRNSILAGASWTFATCSSFRDAVTTGGNYQVFCVFNDRFSFGGVNGGAPSAPNNCGW